MNVHYTSVHLDGDEPVTAGRGINFDSLTIGAGSDQLQVVLGRSIPAADRVRFLRDLSTAASDLADEIDLRDIEAAS